MDDLADYLYVLDAQGEPRNATSYDEWLAFESDPHARVVARFMRNNVLYVSTVFLSSFGLFETMVFRIPGLEHATERRATRADALAVHHEMVAAACIIMGWEQ